MILTWCMVLVRGLVRDGVGVGGSLSDGKYSFFLWIANWELSSWDAGIGELVVRPHVLARTDAHACFIHIVLTHSSQ